MVGFGFQIGLWGWPSQFACLWRWGINAHGYGSWTLLGYGFGVGAAK